MKLNFELKRMLLAIFSEGFILGDKIKTVSEINSKVGEIFNGDPLILPTPEGTPPDFPRIIMRSSDDIYQCSISQNRIEFTYNVQASSIKPDFKDFISQANNICAYFIDDKKNIVNRAGFVINLQSHLDSNVVDLMKTHLLKESTYCKSNKKIKGLALTIAERDKLGDLEVNRQIYIDTLKSDADREEGDIVGLQYDVNTLQEKVNNAQLGIVDINKIMERVSEEIVDEKLNELFE